MIEFQAYQQKNGYVIISNYDYVYGNDCHIIMKDEEFWLESDDGNLHPVSFPKLLKLLLENDSNKINNFINEVRNNV